MKNTTLLLSLTALLTLASCGTQPAPEASTPTTDSASLSALQGNTKSPEQLAQAENVPQVLGQMLALKSAVGTQKLNASSVAAQSTLDVVNPHGVLVMRVEVTGPKKVDLLSGKPFNDDYAYAFVGANAVQDRMYVFGKGSGLSAELGKTLTAIGGRGKVRQIVTTNMMSLIIQTKAGEFYLVGKDKPMTEGELKNSRDEYAQLAQAYQDYPENFEKNKKLWKALAGNTSAEPGQESLASISSQQLNTYTNPDGTLNIEKALGVTNDKLGAQDLKLTPLALRPQAQDGNYWYKGTLAGGGFAQYSTYWGQTDAAGNFLTYNTYPFFSSWNGNVWQGLIGCSAAAAQILIFDMWKKGYGIQYKNAWRSFSPKDRVIPMPDGSSRSVANDVIYHALSGTANMNTNYTYIGQAWGKDDNELVPFKILNEKIDGGFNFSTVAMNAGHHNGNVANKVNDVPAGLGKMLGKVYPGLGIQNVWYEWKTAGKGSTGIMREILATNIPQGRVVLMSYPLGGTEGHTSTVSSAHLNSYPVMWWTGYDAYGAPFDKADTNYLLTGYNVTASGVYSVNY